MSDEDKFDGWHDKTFPGNIHRDSGGPAFPFAISKDTATYFGMSLRDYFAAQALPSLLLGTCHVTLHGKPPTSLQEHADIAYQIADAMLAERKKAQP